MTQRNSTPLVSVIIPTYNNAPYLLQSVESVLKQTYRNFEVIVVDDGSTDNTEAILSPYKASIRYIKQENGGPSVARNTGIACAKGEFIAFQDADDIWLPDKLEAQLAYLHKHTEVGVLFSDLTHFNAQGQVSSSIKNRYGKISSGNIFEELLVNHIIALSSIIVRRNCLDTVGVFDESLIGAEDYNLYLRLARKFQFGFLDEVLVQKRLHENNLSDNLEQMCEDEIKNLDKIAEMFPDASIPKRKLSGRIYARFGKYYFSRQRFDEAKICFQKAFRCSPWLFKTWLFWALSAIPHSLRNSLLALNKMWKGAS